MSVTTIAIADLQRKAKYTAKRLGHNLNKLHITQNEWATIYQATQGDSTRNIPPLRNVQLGFIIDCLLGSRKDTTREALYQQLGQRESLSRQVKKEPRDLPATKKITKPSQRSVRFFSQAQKQKNQLVIHVSGTLNDDAMTKLIALCHSTGATLVLDELLSDEEKANTREMISWELGNTVINVRKPFTPVKHRLLTPKKKSTAHLPARKESYSFSVTSSDLPTTVHRSKSQHQLMRQSSRAFFAAEGITQTEKYQQAWCHIQGLMIGGEHDKENIIPGTRGFNLSQLYLMEIPIKDLLQGKVTDEVHVNINITYSPNTRLPKSFEATLSGTMLDDNDKPVPFKETIRLNVKSNVKPCLSERDTIKFARKLVFDERQVEAPDEHKLPVMKG